MSHKKVTIWPWTSECVCCDKVGLISGQPPRFLLPPPSIYLGGAIHACWCVSECKLEGGSCALSWTSPAPPGEMPRTDLKNARWHLWSRSVWFTSLIKKKTKTVYCASSATWFRVGIIPQNHTLENGELRPSSLWCVFGAAAHVGQTPGTRVSETQADQLLVIRQSLI